MLRRSQLCPGPAQCPYVPMMRDPEPCDECPELLLDEYLASPAGQVILSTIDLDFALQAGVTVSLSEITFPEFLRLRSLSEERNKFHEETMRKGSQRGR
jgi:hypothetical protein